MCSLAAVSLSSTLGISRTADSPKARDVLVHYHKGTFNSSQCVSREGLQYQRILKEQTGQTNTSQLLSLDGKPFSGISQIENDRSTCSLQKGGDGRSLVFSVLQYIPAPHLDAK